MASFTLVTRDIMCIKTKLNNKITFSIYKFHAQFSVPYLGRTAE